jgi:hypothetical protein
METSPVAGILSVTPGTCEKRILYVCLQASSVLCQAPARKGSYMCLQASSVLRQAPARKGSYVCQRQYREAYSPPTLLQRYFVVAVGMDWLLHYYTVVLLLFRNGYYHYEKTNEDVTTMKLTKISLTHKVATLFHFFLFFAFSALALTHATRFRAFTSW